MAARRFVKAGACVNEKSDFVHCALEQTRCEEGHEFMTSRQIEEKSLSHATRACLEPHSVQSIYGGRCSNPDGDSFCTAHNSACQTGDFVLTRECTVLSNFLDGEYATSVYGSCDGFCAFSANECPGDFVPASGSESLGDCTCLRVQTGACIRGGIPYCAVSQASCGGDDETYVHVPELASQYATTCFLCSNPFNPFDFWPTPYNGIVTPGKTPIIIDSSGNALQNAPVDPSSGEANVPLEEESSKSFVGAKLTLSFFVIGVIVAGLYCRWRRVMKGRDPEFKDRNLHDISDDDDDEDGDIVEFLPWVWQGTRHGIQTARDEIPELWDQFRHEQFPAAWDRIREEMAKLGTNETFGDNSSPSDGAASAEMSHRPAEPFRDWEQYHNKDWNKVETKKAPSREEEDVTQSALETSYHDRDLLYEVAMEGALNEEADNTAEKVPQYSDDHLVQFDKALESSMSLLNNESEDAVVPDIITYPSNSQEAVKPKVMKGNTTLEVTKTTYEDLLGDAEEEGCVTGPIVEIQENGSMLV